MFEKGLLFRNTCDKIKIKKVLMAKEEIEIMQRGGEIFSLGN